MLQAAGCTLDSASEHATHDSISSIVEVNGDAAGSSQ
jgi:hypothetical protein